MSSSVPSNSAPVADRQAPCPTRRTERTKRGPWDVSGLVLGTNANVRSSGFGFASRSTAASSSEPKLVRHSEPAHGIVFSRTGGGKFVSTIAPNVLAHQGPLFVVDPKGEIAAVTARHRRTLGDVVIIDPFEVLGASSGMMNPMDVFSLPGINVEDSAETLAWELSAGHESSKDPFWQNTATALIAGLVASAALDPDPSRRHLGTVVDALSSDDVTYSLAVAMDTKKIYGDFAKKRVAEYLQVPDGSASTRGCILASAQQYIHCLQADRVRRTIESSSCNLADVLSGERVVTVYFVFPVTKFKSHRGLLRLWLSTLFTTLAARTCMPEKQTLVVIDEAANLGRIDQLGTMHTFLRGSGVSLLTAWQSLGQLSDLYPAEWRTIVENCGVIQAFSLHATAIDALATLLGVVPTLLRSMSKEEQLVAVADRAPEVFERIDYRTHPAFRNLVDPNPRYSNRQENSR